MKDNKRQLFMEIGFVILCGCFFFIWSIVKELNYAPDEFMRYQIPQYIFEHGALPDGNMDELRNGMWGFSYAYYPNMLGPLLSAVFMKAVSFFTAEEFALLAAARFTSVLCGSLTIWFLLKIGGRLFSTRTKWMVAFLAALIPQFAFLSSYVNNDIICVCGSGMICCAWVSGLQDGWNLKNAALLAGGISVTTLSYYNGYGWILCSLLLFCGSFLIDGRGQADYHRMRKTGILIAGVVLLFTMGFFIRNAILYHGDFLGMRALAEASEKYGAEYLKPSNRETPKNLGLTIWEMLQSRRWNSLGWIKMSFMSFVGVFGYMDNFLPMWIYKIYAGIFIAAGAGFLADAAGCIAHRGESASSAARKRRLLFLGSLILTAVIPVLLSIYYSWAVDYQAQGRYFYPAFISLMTICGFGIEWLLQRINSNKVRSLLVVLLCGCLLALSSYVFQNIYLPSA